MSKMMNLNITITIYTIYTHIHTRSGLNNPIKRQRLSDWIEKQDPTPYKIHYLQEPYFKYEDTNSLKGKGKRSAKLTLKIKLECLY